MSFVIENKHLYSSGFIKRLDELVRAWNNMGSFDNPDDFSCLSFALAKDYSKEVELISGMHYNDFLDSILEEKLFTPEF